MKYVYVIGLFALAILGGAYNAGVIPAVGGIPTSLGDTLAIICFVILILMVLGSSRRPAKDEKKSEGFDHRLR